MRIVSCSGPVSHFFDVDASNTCPICGAGEKLSATVSGISDKNKKSGGGLFKKHKKEKADISRQSNYSDSSSNGYSTTPQTTPLSEESFHKAAEHVPDKPIKITDESQNGLGGKTVDLFSVTAGASTCQDSIVEGENTDCNEEPDLVESLSQGPETETVKEPDAEAKSVRDAIKKVSASSDGKTVSYFESVSRKKENSVDLKSKSADPVVGWLVAVAGNHFGESFNIYYGNNSIGRSGSNKIVLSMDNGVSRNNHAFIVFDPKKCAFYVRPGDSSGLIYVNDENVLTSKQIVSFDVIEVSNTKMVFVPLCGESFSWDEYRESGE